MSKIEIIVKLMVKIKFNACYLRIRFWDFSLDFTDRVTLSSFYKYALDKNITGVHFEAKQWTLHTLRSLKCKHFSLGLSLSLVYETGG